MLAALVTLIRRPSLLRVVQAVLVLAALVALLYTIGAPEWQGG